MAAQADVVICSVSEDKDLAKYIGAGLKKAGMSVSDSGTNAKDFKNETILTCRVFILILSDNSASNDTVRDQMALAYVSNKPVIPVAVKFYRYIAPQLTSGLKLMLAKINWVFFVKKEQYAGNLEELCKVISGFMAEVPANAVEETPREENEGRVPRVALNKYRSRVEKYEGEDEDQGDKTGAGVVCEFWDRHFQNKSETTWVEFRERFIADYGERINRNYEEDTQRIFVNLIYKDILELNKVVTRARYDDFTGPNSNADPDLFYNRLQDYVVGYLALREVFNMDSTVRLTAVGNLGSFQTPAVISMLFELTEDADPNVRAVAALALAKTGKRFLKLEDHLMMMLNDEDRLVRESACLSLGHMRCERATHNIVDTWRNDPIKHVREAAEIALKRMGSEPAREAIHITEVLTEEMLFLKATRDRRQHLSATMEL